jgi:copper(I)-binding protein
MKAVNHKLRLLCKSFVRLGVVTLWVCTQPAAAGDQDLEFADAWIRAVPPGMGMTAGFGTIRNSGEVDIEITAFSSREFGDVSLHRTERSDGMSRMREVPSLQVPAKSSVELAPGGYHLMLMTPRVTLQEGQPVAVEMTASDGRVFRFEVPAERR